MKNALSPLLTSLFVSLLAPTAIAQAGAPPLDASYALKKIDGTAIDPGFNFGIVCIPVLGIPGAYMFLVMADEIEAAGVPDTGWTILEDESGYVMETGSDTWAWQNQIGTTGTLKLKAGGGGDIESTVESGPNKGTQRLWDAR